jgi:hypothetical protein
MSVHFIPPLLRTGCRSFRIALVTALLVGVGTVAPAQQTSDQSAAAAAHPEMHKLFRAFLGRWTVKETFERNEYSPGGGERTGTARFTIGSGGTSLVEDYHSNGSAGRLDFLAVIWWDPGARAYRVFTCANEANACALRGSGAWSGATFTSDYVQSINGMSTKLQDVFSEISPSSFKLVSGIPGDDSKVQPLITTIYRRIASAD